MSLRPEVLARIRRSHIGIEGCLRCVRESVSWPGMTAALKNHVNWCDVCRTFEMAQQKEKLHPHEVPDKPWSKVAVDLFEFSNRHYLVTVDYYSNFWEVDRMESSTTPKAVISKLKQHVTRHGIPDKVVSDNGPQFDSDEFRRFACEWEFERVTSSPGHAQSNGLAESAVKTVKRLIRKAHEDGKDPWLALLNQRNTPTEGMRNSPVQRLMSRRTRTLLQVRETLLKLKLAESVQEERNKIKMKQAFYYNRNAKNLLPLEKGDTVRLQPLKNRKEPWKKATVQEKVNVGSYNVLTENGSILRRNRRHLKTTKEQLLQPQTDEMPQDNNTLAAQETAASPFKLSEKPPSPETPVKLPTANSALTTQPVGERQTCSG